MPRSTRPITSASRRRLRCRPRPEAEYDAPSLALPAWTRVNPVVPQVESVDAPKVGIERRQIRDAFCFSAGQMDGILRPEIEGGDMLKCSKAHVRRYHYFDPLKLRQQVASQ